MSMAIWVLVMENKMSDFSDILISCVDVIKLNHTWHPVKITLSQRPCLMPNYSPFYFLSNVKNPIQSISKPKRSHF